LSFYCICGVLGSQGSHLYTPLHSHSQSSYKRPLVPWR